MADRTSGRRSTTRTSGERRQLHEPAPPAGDKISFSELERRLHDIDVPDRDLRPYLTGDPSASAPFAPVVLADPDRVEQIVLLELDDQLLVLAFDERHIAVLHVSLGSALEPSNPRADAMCSVLGHAESLRKSGGSGVTCNTDLN